MEITWHSDARQDLQQFDSETQTRLIDNVGQFEEKPLGENTSIVNKQGLEAYRLKLKNDDLDHRVFFIFDGNRITIIGVLHRDNAYTSESIEELRSRQ